MMFQCISLIETTHKNALEDKPTTKSALEYQEEKSESNDNTLQYHDIPSSESIPLNPINEKLPGVYTNGCCGIGHRLTRVVPTISYANNASKKAYIFWGDVSWSTLFHDTPYVQSIGSDEFRNTGKNDTVIYNHVPPNWPNFAK
eukprot:3041569-Ditylum_brightwellii.AAC.1